MVFGFAKWIKSLVLTLRPYVGTLRSADGNVALIRLLRSHLPPQEKALVTPYKLIALYVL